MKKSILLILASLFAIFALAGCADDSKNDTPVVTSPTVVPIDQTNSEAFKGLLGNYEITFFYTNGAGSLPISSDCSQITYWTGSTDEKCVQGTNDVSMKGYGTISIDNTQSNVLITTKMQMTNQYLQNPSSAIGTTSFGPLSSLFAAAQSNQYNYTVYKPIPITAIDNGTFNAGQYEVKGTTGRDLRKLLDQPNDKYKFNLLSDGSIKITMKNTSSAAQLVGGADVTIIMKKIDALPQNYNMNKDEQFPEPVISGFVTDPQ